MHATKHNPSRARCRAMSPEFAAAIQPIKEAAAKLKRRSGRSEIYDLLEAIYHLHSNWKRRKIAKRSAHAFADELKIVQRKGMSPIRILIEVALPTFDFKQKSRWVRALEYVAYEDVSANTFRQFVLANGGLAGCARSAALANRKRRRSRREAPEGDWTD
jgi:hypothetical protein